MVGNSLNRTFSRDLILKSALLLCAIAFPSSSLRAKDKPVQMNDGTVIHQPLAGIDGDEVFFKSSEGFFFRSKLESFDGEVRDELGRRANVIASTNKIETSRIPEARYFLRRTALYQSVGPLYIDLKQVRKSQNPQYVEIGPLGFAMNGLEFIFSCNAEDLKAFWRSVESLRESVPDASRVLEDLASFRKQADLLRKNWEELPFVNLSSNIFSAMPVQIVQQFDTHHLIARDMFGNEFAFTDDDVPANIWKSAMTSSIESTNSNLHASHRDPNAAQKFRLFTAGRLTVFAPNLNTDFMPLGKQFLVYGHGAAGEESIPVDEKTAIELMQIRRHQEQGQKPLPLLSAKLISRDPHQSDPHQAVEGTSTFDQELAALEKDLQSKFEDGNTSFLASVGAKLIYAKAGKYYLIKSQNCKVCIVDESSFDSNAKSLADAALRRYRLLVTKYQENKDTRKWWKDFDEGGRNIIEQPLTTVRLAPDAKITSREILVFKDGTREEAEPRDFYSKNTWRLLDADRLLMTVLSAIKTEEQFLDRIAKPIFPPDEEALLAKKAAREEAAKKAEDAANKVAIAKRIALEQTFEKKSVKYYENQSELDTELRFPIFAPKTDSPNIAHPWFLMRSKRTAFRGVPLYETVDGLVFRIGTENAMLYETQLDAGSLVHARQAIAGNVGENVELRLITKDSGEIYPSLQELDIAGEGKSTRYKPGNDEGPRHMRLSSDPTLEEELRADIRRRSSGTKRDLSTATAFDKRLDELPLLEELPLLDPQYKALIDQLQREEVDTNEWHEIDVDGSQKLAAVSADGNLALFAGERVELFNLLTGNRLVVTGVTITAGDRCEIVNGSELLILNRGGLQQYSVTDKKVVKQYNNISIDDVRCCNLAPNHRWFFVLYKNGRAERIDVTQQTTKIIDKLGPNFSTSEDLRCFIADSGNSALFSDLKVTRIVDLDPVKWKEDFPNPDQIGVVLRPVAFNDKVRAFSSPSHPGIRYYNETHQGEVFPQSALPLAFTTVSRPSMTTGLAVFNSGVGTKSRLTFIDGKQGRLIEEEGVWRDDSRFASDGLSAFFVKNNRWGRLGLQYNNRPWRPIVVELAKLTCESRDFGQVEAVGRELRSNLISHMGDYTDEVFSKFVESVPSYIFQLDSIQGGDVQARCDRRLRKWCEKCPSSQVLVLVHTKRQIELAWIARGSGIASPVTEEGWQEFSDRIVDATRGVASVLKNPSPPAEAFQFGHKILKCKGYTREKFTTFTDRIMKSDVADNPRIHREAIQTLLPRWHGEIGDCERYMEHVAQQLGGGTGDCVYLEMVRELYSYHGLQVFEDFSLTVDRIARGIQSEFEERGINATVNGGLQLLLLANREDLITEVLRNLPEDPSDMLLIDWTQASHFKSFQKKYLNPNDE